MKRLLCIVGKMDAGGAETFLMKVYRKLDRTQYQMDFAVAAPGKGIYEDEIVQLGGRIYRITPKSEGTVKNFKAIMKLVKDNQYKFVMRISQHSLSALELLAAKMGGAKRCIFRSSNSNTTSSSKLNNILHKICMFMPRAFADIRIAPSTEAAEFMFGKGCIQKGRAFLLPNAIDLDLYKYDEETRNMIRRDYGIGDKLVLGHVGRFNVQKNHVFLIEVFRNVLESVPNAVLMLVGKGELEDSIRELVEQYNMMDHVIFMGVRSDVHKLLSAMDVFVFPSLYEGMPNTVIEAQATGLPCIISDRVTKEAGIADHVHFISLEAQCSEWKRLIVEAAKENREKNSKQLQKAGYDINDMCKQFTKLVFE